MKVDEELMHCSTCVCEGCSVSRRWFVPSNPPAPPPEEVAEGEREDDEVETCEVNFVPLEDNDDVVVEAEGDIIVDSDSDDDDVVIQDDYDDVVVGGAGKKKDDVQVEELEEDCYTECEKRNRDKRLIDEVYAAVGMEGIEGDTEKFVFDQRVKAARFWKSQVEIYEQKILDLKGSLEWVSERFRAVKQREEYQTKEVTRLVKLVNKRNADVNRLDERVYKMAEEISRIERMHSAGKRSKIRRIEDLKKELAAEKCRNHNLESELGNTRKRLLTFKRRSCPRRNRKRVVRRIDSYEDGDESSVSIKSGNSEEENISNLIDLMDNRF